MGLGTSRITVLRVVLPLVVPGTSLMVTDAPVLEHTTGKPIAVLSSHPAG